MSNPTTKRQYYPRRLLSFSGLQNYLTSKLGAHDPNPFCQYQLLVYTYFLKIGCKIIRQDVILCSTPQSSPLANAMPRLTLFLYITFQFCQACEFEPDTYKVLFLSLGVLFLCVRNLQTFVYILSFNLHSNLLTKVHFIK